MTNYILNAFLNGIALGRYTRVEESREPPTSKPPNPKGFFANERTFLSWLQFSLVLGSLSVALLNYSSSTTGLVSAFAFAFISVGLMIYSYIVFRWRANKIMNKETGFYDERIGPVALITAVILAVLINFWLNFAANLL